MTAVVVSSCTEISRLGSQWFLPSHSTEVEPVLYAARSGQTVLCNSHLPSGLGHHRLLDLLAGLGLGLGGLDGLGGHLVGGLQVEGLVLHGRGRDGGELLLQPVDLELALVHRGARLSNLASLVRRNVEVSDLLLNVVGRISGDVGVSGILTASLGVVLRSSHRSALALSPLLQASIHLRLEGNYLLLQLFPLYDALLALHGLLYRCGHGDS